MSKIAEDGYAKLEPDWVPPMDSYRRTDWDGKDRYRGGFLPRGQAMPNQEMNLSPHDD